MLRSLTSRRSLWGVGWDPSVRRWGVLTHLYLFRRDAVEFALVLFINTVNRPYTELLDFKKTKCLPRLTLNVINEGQFPFE